MRLANCQCLSSYGYAKQTVSSLCNHFFTKGIPNAILFTADDNIPAQKTYTAIGFTPIDTFTIAEFT